jgi:hypothetical protein
LRDWGGGEEWAHEGIDFEMLEDFVGGEVLEGAVVEGEIDT